MDNETGTPTAICKSLWKRRGSDYAGAREMEAGAATVSAGDLVWMVNEPTRQGGREQTISSAGT
jgi:hypothetical protein